MLRHLIAAVLLLLASSTTALAEDAPPPGTCLTCGGSGTATLACRECGGDGKGLCEDCTRDRAREASEWLETLLGLTDPEGLEQFLAEQKQFEKKKAALGQWMKLGNIDPATLAPGATPGFLPCPALCNKGVSTTHAPLACKACDGNGLVECRTCKGKAIARCQPCRGKKRIEATCPECFGHGRAPDPLARTEDAERCPWCDDGKLRSCDACDVRGKWKRACLVCDGDGALVCQLCRGTGSAACTQCGGTGVRSNILGTQTKKCDACRAKGKLNCPNCKKGTLKCEACKGRGRIAQEREPCRELRQALCTGCYQGEELAWSMTASHLFQAERYPEAVAHMEVAERRARARLHDQVAAFKGTDKQRKALRKKFDRELAAMSRRAAAMKAKL